MSESKDPHDWDWYVGDPCYVIDNGRWDDFCNLMFDEEARIRKEIRARDPRRWQYEDEKGVTHQKYIPINHDVTIDWPILDDDGEELWTVEIEIWSSPTVMGVGVSLTLLGTYHGMNPSTSRVRKFLWMLAS